jgi:integrase
MERHVSAFRPAAFRVSLSPLQGRPDAAIAENPDMASLRFHDLRHTFGTLATRDFDLVNAQAMMGHADSWTMVRYPHAQPIAEDAATTDSPR